MSYFPKSSSGSYSDLSNKPVLGTASGLNIGTGTGQVPIVPVPMISLSSPVKSTIDGITAAGVDSAAYHPASDFATTIQGAKADTALQGEVDPVALAALALHEADNANPHDVTATQLGFDQVDNTSDADKPVSVAQQSALDAKMDTDTALSMLADMQSKYEDLNQQVLLLLKFVITTFDQVPEGLEEQFEAALGA